MIREETLYISPNPTDTIEGEKEGPSQGRMHVRIHISFLL
jgi:hypothetical protein